jgi:endonuclease YncB( thermonuclease family)
MRVVVAVLALLLWAGPGRAAETIVSDANTLQQGAVKYRLDGIDAPEFDQVCIDQHADQWTCGVEARDQLRSHIGDRAVRCEDKGPDPAFRNRRLGVCSVEGEPGSLNQWLVQQGLALNSDPARDRFKADEADAKDKQKGLWKGCFVAPSDFRQWKINGALLGAACRKDKEAELRAALFPDEPAMPPGCTIKGKLAARAILTGKVGVYQMQSCRNYASQTKPNRWFCSEDDAQAAGYRKAYNCGNLRRK